MPGKPTKPKSEKPIVTFHIPRLTKMNVDSMADDWNREIGKGQEKISTGEVCRRCLSLYVCGFTHEYFLPVSKLARAMEPQMERGNDFEQLLGNITNHIRERARVTGKALGKAEIIRWIEQNAANPAGMNQLTVLETSDAPNLERMKVAGPKSMQPA